MIQVLLFIQNIAPLIWVTLISLGLKKYFKRSFYVPIAIFWSLYINFLYNYIVPKYWNILWLYDYSNDMSFTPFNMFIIIVIFVLILLLAYLLSIDLITLFKNRRNLKNLPSNRDTWFVIIWFICFTPVLMNLIKLIDYLNR